ncbi:MAG TPA: hypothetical protein VGS22_27715 [Thermoanaerobaculia bacterium]|jgi:hypothetical protein|nr:hypothetical protein [Thermoanaerobaculia bacterium]
MSAPEALAPTDPSRRLSAWALVAAIFALGQAIEVGGARFSILGLVWAGAALAICAAIVAGLTDQSRSEPSERALIAFGAAVFSVQILQLFNSDPSVTIAPSFDWTWFQAGILVAGALGLASFFASPAWRIRLSLLLLALHLVLGVWIVRSQPNPAIDVFVFQEVASRALVAGGDPYRLSMPDIYAEEESAKLYAPGWSVGGRLRFGFPYPPLSLLLALPGSLLGDHRFAQLLATTIAAAAIAFLRPSRLGALATALFLFNPRGFYVLEQAWTEPFVMMLFAVFLFAATRAPRRAFWPFGLLLAVKQYLFVILPLLPLLAPWCVPKKSLPRLALTSLAVAVAITAPFVLWDPGAFYTSVIAVHLAQPYRPDSLTFLALLPDSTAAALAILSPLAALGALGLALWRGARTPTGFAAAAALVLLAFFSFGKQAHANYFYLVTGMLCAALAAIDTPGTADQNLPVPST